MSLSLSLSLFRVVGKSTSALFLSFFLSFFLSLRAVSAWSRSRGRTIDHGGPGVRANDVFLAMMWDRLGGNFLRDSPPISLSLLSLSLSPR